MQGENVAFVSLWNSLSLHQEFSTVDRSPAVGLLGKRADFQLCPGFSTLDSTREFCSPSAGGLSTVLNILSGLKEARRIMQRGDRLYSHIKYHHIEHALAHYTINCFSSLYHTTEHRLMLCSRITCFLFTFTSTAAATVVTIMVILYWAITHSI